MDTSFQEQSRQETVSAAAISHPRIFISHSAKDNKFGEKLAADLRRVVGDDDAIWYDVLELHGGDTWWRKIMRELTARDAFIIILSPDSMDSYWVQQEVDIATNYRKYIVPVLYKECEIRPDLQIKQIISFLPPADYEIAFNELLTALGLSRSESLPSPPVRPAPTSSDVSSSKGFSQVEEAPTVGQENQTSAGSEVAPAEKPQSETILPEKPVSRRGIPPVRIAILAGLAILIIASGVIGFSLLSGGNQGKQTSGAATANAQLTATAQANAAPASTIEAQVHATASAIATTQSVVNATATAYAPTQTAIDATVTASGNHFPDHLGTLVFNDS